MRDYYTFDDVPGFWTDVRKRKLARVAALVFFLLAIWWSAWPDDPAEQEAAEDFGWDQFSTVPQIVRFSNGAFGIRRTDTLLRHFEYLDAGMTKNAHQWWGAPQFREEYEFATEAAAQEKLNWYSSIKSDVGMQP
jgi:hypothetical protein